MGGVQVTDGLTFSLRGKTTLYAFRVTEEGLLEHLYFGPDLAEPPAPMRRELRHCTVMFEDSERLSLNALAQEFSMAGRGDFGFPALRMRGAENSVVSLSYAGHRVEDGKPAPDGLPASRGTGAQTLVVTLRDAVQGLEVDLHYTVWADSDVIARRAVLRNTGEAALSLRGAASLSVDLPPGDYDVQHFSGTWAREFELHRQALPQARYGIGSTRGTSSNAHLPYMALLAGDATETAGRCLGVTLVYSGNHELVAERGEFGRVRLSAGINREDFDWTLAPGEAFETPEALLAMSDAGLGGLSHVWHDFIRIHVTPERFASQPRPTYLNTWEAAYFDVDEDTVVSIADRAQALGVDMLVLDDGWFKGRTDDARALGDWTADPDRFASGIPALAEKVRARGLKFGLWFEPEMVSPDSDLYRAHPNWVIGVPGRKPSLGRNQLTLDLSKPEVVDHIFGQLEAHLSTGAIDYVKWDMNRNMTEAPSGEAAHRYMLGLYDLLDRVTTAYPDVLFENCASGGNRFDLGMLSYMPQGWISDMCDPVGRLAIVTGASHLFPTDVMAAYIGPSPNHQNGRVSSVEARYLAGVPCAAQGMSLSPDDIAASEDELRALMADAKASAAERLGARFDRLRHTANETIWQQTSADGQTVRVVAFQTLNAPNLPQRRLRLRGLDPAARYRLEGGETVGGDGLMHHGFDLPLATQDFEGVLLTLRKSG
jgi:alpha-galactosidase